MLREYLQLISRIPPYEQPQADKPIFSIVSAMSGNINYRSIGIEMNVPDFLCIGAQRSGTTWLDFNFRRHPELWLPPIKELHFFDEREFLISQNKTRTTILNRAFGNSPYDCWFRRHARLLLRKGIRRAVRRNDLTFLRWAFRYWTCFENSDYGRLFGLKGSKIAGEVTPEYSMVRSSIVEDIHGFLPTAKIIFFMRDPIERVWSQLCMNLDKEDKQLGAIPEEEILTRKELQDPWEISRGRYFEIIEKWSLYYPKENIFLGFFEEINSCPQELMARLFSFLGVSADSDTLDKVYTRKKHASAKPAIIPSRVERLLAEAYADDLKQLARVYDGYATRWLERVESLAAVDEV